MGSREYPYFLVEVQVTQVSDLGRLASISFNRDSESPVNLTLPLLFPCPKIRKIALF